MNQPAQHVRRAQVSPHPAPETPRHLRVVDRAERTPAQRQRRARVILVSGIGAAVAVMFGLVYLHVVLAQRQIELDRMNSVAAARQSQYQTLRLKVAQLESPQQIISTAEGKLGMRQPASVTYVTPPAGAAATSSSSSSSSSTTPVAPAGGPASAAGSSTHTTPGTAVAPAGDADWPRIKAELAGRP